jgi:hypothetical protein
VRITSPVAETYTNRTIRITAAIDQDVHLPVTLRANQLYLGTVSPPDYRLDWDTTTVAEAPYDVVAQLEIEGRTITSDSVRVVVDRTAPTVVSRTVLQHDGGAKLSAPIKVGFSEPMDAASITTQAIAFAADGASVPITTVLGADGKTATITINNRSALTLPARFEGTFAAGMTDLAGNALVRPATPWTWFAPAVFIYPLSANTPFTVPALAIGPDLEPSVAYAGSPPGQTTGYVLNVHTTRGSQGWIQLPRPTTREFSSEIRPNIIVDDHGYPIVTWQEDGDLKVAFWDGQAWTTPLPPLDGDDNPSTPVLKGTRLALGPGGELFVAWGEDVGSGTDIFVARATAGAWDKSFGSLGLPILVGATNLADLAVDDDGAVRVAWGGLDNPGGISTWQGHKWVTSTPPGALLRVSAMRDETGASLAVQARPALTVVRLVGNAWQDAFSALPVEAFAYSSLGVGPDRKPAVGWINGDGTLGLARWRGNNWDTRAAASITSMTGTGSVGDPLMSLDAQGNMWVRWIHYPNVDIYMSNY